jgi:hypothetical protein
MDGAPGQAVEATDFDDSGVVDYAVRRAEPFRRRSDDALRGSRRGDVGANEVHGGSRPAQAAGGASPSRGGALRDDDGEAGIGKGARGSEADAASRAGDQGYSARHERL